VQDIAERKAAARANLTAAQMAKARGAFSQGLEFARFGLQFLQRGAVDTPLDAWLAEPELSLTLHEIAAELALLNGELRLMHQLCDVILRHTSAPLQRVLTFDIRICGLKAEKKFALAVDAALVILAELGVRFPKRPSRLYGIWRFFLTRHHVL